MRCADCFAREEPATAIKVTVTRGGDRWADVTGGCKNCLDDMVAFAQDLVRSAVPKPQPEMAVSID